MPARPVAVALSTVMAGSALNLLDATVPDACKRMCEPVALLSGACTRAEVDVFPPLADVPCPEDPASDDGADGDGPPISVWAPPRVPTNRTLILKISLPLSRTMILAPGAVGVADPSGLLVSLLNITLPLPRGKGKGKGKGKGSGKPRPTSTPCKAERQRLEKASFRSACYCQNQSFDVAQISGLCANCILQHRCDGPGGRRAAFDSRRILAQCGFPQASFTPDSAKLVDGITIIALLPTRVASPPGGSTTTGPFFAPAAATRTPTPATSWSSVRRNPEVPTITAIYVPAPEQQRSGSAHPISISILHLTLVHLVVLGAWLA
ncbi:hypothetical protein GGTG_03469 [Gaeumannomyces tritici R3-111a-1]|uniref:Extracellular membrane protein CFEM domain-containing protein n=1 Tax=Gaeumannomyces tritici (strain R3-111a-1) TaxID=644352 RepID=J3NQB2_GAET3|nr:hypothetical protein GGTG_03469 [Gaeumannomyces tritici R3-111a-1]EJT78368.1 hypothetical protein GGTG_03469 [Gaeumannomyces tritici R3-111a-1]